MRKLWIPLALLMLLFAGCAGKTEETPAGLYYHEPAYVNRAYSTPNLLLGRPRGVPIQNGALVHLEAQTLSQSEIIIQGNSFQNPRLFGVFDEESKTLVPLCSRPGCDHTSETCFANKLYGNHYLMHFGAYKGHVFAVYVNRNGYCVDYYTPEGELVKTVSFRPEQELALTTMAYQNGYMIYFIDPLLEDFDAVYQKNQPGPARWQIHSYNLETETFAYVTEFTTPDMDETRVQFGAIFEDRLYFTYDDRYLYVFDAGENTVTQLFDFKELSNEPGFDGAYGFRIDPTEEGALFFNRMGLNRYN